MEPLTKLEKQVLDNLSQRLDPRVELGVILRRAIRELRSETAEDPFTEEEHFETDHTGITGIPDTTGLLDETAHDLLDHEGLTGIPDTTGLLDETAHDLLDHGGLPGVESNAGFGVSENNAVDGGDYEDINLTMAAGSFLVTKLEVAATDGQETPDIDYDIEFFTDSDRLLLAYKAAGITDVDYVDAVPWEWFGGTIMYIRVTNNKAAALTDVDITVNYRK